MLLPCLAAFLLVASLAAQAGPQRGPEPPSAPVAVLTATLYNDQANVREASDSAKALLATEVLRTRLSDSLGNQVLSYPLIDSVAGSPAALQLTGAVSCSLKIDCARAVGSQVGAHWVVLVKVSKTSSLIWLLSAQLIRVSTGEIILDDTTELKGEPERMVRLGVRQFADRVIRTVRNGGYSTNFPNGPPSP